MAESLERQFLNGGQASRQPPSHPSMRQISYRIYNNNKLFASTTATRGYNYLLLWLLGWWCCGCCCCCYRRAVHSEPVFHENLIQKRVKLLLSSSSSSMWVVFIIAMNWLEVREGVTQALELCKNLKEILASNWWALSKLWAPPRAIFRVFFSVCFCVFLKFHSNFYSSIVQSLSLV